MAVDSFHSQPATDPAVSRVQPLVAADSTAAESGLDPLLQNEFVSLVEEAVSAGATVFLSSHVLPEVEALARRVAAELTATTEALFAARMALEREQKLQHLGGVVAAAAHELGTPLATIKLVSSELAEGARAKPPNKECGGWLLSMEKDLEAMAFGRAMGSHRPRDPRCPCANARRFFTELAHLCRAGSADSGRPSCSWRRTRHKGRNIRV